MAKIIIDIEQIVDNYLVLKDYSTAKGVLITPVTKVVAGDIVVARALSEAGAEVLADSRIKNIRKFVKQGINSKFLLLRSPAKSELEDVVKYSDFSLNSSIETVGLLDNEAGRQHKKHGIILMLEMGDLREGTTVENAIQIKKHIDSLDNVYLKGIGANFACYGGVIPSLDKMKTLSDVVDYFGNLDWVSGGNSANLLWLSETKNVGNVNHLRIGEAIMLGCETIRREQFLDLNTDSFVLSAEVIESEKKYSVPDGEIAQDAFGNVPVFQDIGFIYRAIIALGRQDVGVGGLDLMVGGCSILGASSDHLILKTDLKLDVGQVVEFTPNYSCLLRAMTSPYIKKVYK